MEFLPSEDIREYTIAGMHIESQTNFDIVIDHYKYTNIKKVHVRPWHCPQSSGDNTNITFPLKLWSHVDH